MMGATYLFTQRLKAASVSFGATCVVTFELNYVT